MALPKNQNVLAQANHFNLFIEQLSNDEEVSTKGAEQV